MPQIIFLCETLTANICVVCDIMDHGIVDFGQILTL